MVGLSPIFLWDGITDLTSGDRALEPASALDVAHPVPERPAPPTWFSIRFRAPLAHDALASHVNKSMESSAGGFAATPTPGSIAAVGHAAFRVGDEQKSAHAGFHSNATSSILCLLG